MSVRRRLDENLIVEAGVVRCSHCDALVGSDDSWLEHALFKEGPAQSFGTLVPAAPELFVDAPIVTRQAFCPGCLTVLLTEVVASADRDRRLKRLGPESTPSPDLPHQSTNHGEPRR